MARSQVIDMCAQPPKRDIPFEMRVVRDDGLESVIEQLSHRKIIAGVFGKPGRRHKMSDALRSETGAIQE